MRRKNKQVENRLRSNEAKDILLAAIQKEALQNMSWLTEDIDAALDAEDQKERAREIMERVKAQAYYEASQIQVKKHLLPSAIRDILESVRWKICQAPKLATILLAFLILGSFLLTKPGVAFAKNAYAIAARWINGMLNIQQTIEPQDNESPLNYVDLPETFLSFEAAASYLNRPVAAIQNNEITLSTIHTYKADNSFIVLESTYNMPNGSTITSWQHFYDPSVQAIGASTPVNEEPQAYTLYNGITIYLGTGVEEDAYGQANWEYGQLFITGPKLELTILSNLIQDLIFVRG